MSFKDRHPSPKFVFAANTIFALSGLFNFIVFFITRPSWVIGGNNRGERRQRTGGRPRRAHGLPPPGNSRPSSPQESEKEPDVLDEGYSQQPRISLTLPPERQPSSSLNYFPPGRIWWLTWHIPSGRLHGYFVWNVCCDLVFISRLVQQGSALNT